MNSKVRILLLSMGATLLVGVLYMALNFIGALTLGIFIYYCTRPVYRFLRDNNVGKTISAIVAQLTFILPSIVLLAYTLQIVSFEIRAFAADASGTIGDVLQNQELIERILEQEGLFGFNINDEIGISSEDTGIDGIRSLLGNINSDTIDSILNVSVSLISDLISSISGLFFTLFIAFALSFYLQRDGEKIKSKVMTLLDYDRDLYEYLDRLDADLRVVFLGNIALALGTAVVGATSFYLITLLVPGGEVLKYPGLVGFLCGIASLIPVVGMKLVYFPLTAILLVVSVIRQPLPEALVFPVVFFVVAAIIVDTIPDLVARPYLGSLSGVSTSVLLFSYILGPLAFGWYGLFLGPLIFVSAYEFVLIILPLIVQEYQGLID